MIVVVEIQQAKAQMLAAEALRDYARASLQRTQLLFERKATSEDDLQDRESVTAAAMMDDLAHDARSLHLYVRRMLSPNRSGRRLLLVVDQFEELFTQCRDPAQRKACQRRIIN